jgi:[ribosomal protein S18]-alanine N-acetyltransferase
MSGDLDRIMQVMDSAFDPAFGEAWTRAQVESALAMGNCRILLIDPAGMVPEPGHPAAAFSLVRSVAGEDELLLIAVDPAHRRRGLAGKLLDMVIADSRRRSSTSIHLEMRQGNPAEHLYRKRGFVPVGLRPNYYRSPDGDRLDAITFCIDL